MMVMPYALAEAGNRNNILEAAARLYSERDKNCKLRQSVLIKHNKITQIA